MPPVDMINWIAGGGVTVALLIALWGVVQAKWITRHHYDEIKALLQKKDDDLERMRTERDIWIERTLRLNKITAEASVQTMKAVVTKVEE